MKIDALASYPHYADHLWPVWEQLPEETRGIFYSATRRQGVQHPIPNRWPNEIRPVLVAGWLDARRAINRPLVYLEHGAGQSYPGDVAAATHGSYSGGEGLEAVRLFLCPSETVARRWRDTYADALAVVVGCPRLDTIKRQAQKTPTVAITYHWDCPLIFETRSAIEHYDRAMPQFVEAIRANGFELIGHAHPRARRRLEARWEQLGVRYEPNVDRVLEAASVVVADNTSLMWEAAALDIPLVIMNAPWYRRDVEHGLRFWEHADAGVMVDDPAQLCAAVVEAYADVDPQRIESRRRAASAVYSRLDGSASRRASEAITALLEDEVSLTHPHTHDGPKDPQIQPELEHFLMRLRMLGASDDELAQVRQHWETKDEQWTEEYRRQLISSSDGHLVALIEDIRDEYPFEPEHAKAEALEQNADGMAIGVWEDNDDQPDFSDLGVRGFLRWVRNDKERANIARTWELETAQREGREVRRSLVNRMDLIIRGGTSG